PAHAGCGDPENGLVGWWKLDDGSSGTTPTTAADSSGNGNNGANQNNPVWTSSGKIGDALTFSGSSQYVSVPDSSSLDISGSWTESAWVNFSAMPTSSDMYNIIFKGNGGGNQPNYAIALDNGYFGSTDTLGL
ncbi:MAG TPA: hypothetical protein VMW15_14650, partial [Terracidiphilus sp.]|nr:hypothetical protein [Terracidiphilus sp.]